MDEQLTTALTVTALEMALGQRAVLAGLLHQFGSRQPVWTVAYRHRLVSGRIRCSMSRPGNCWDNAVVEGFFATQKTELMRGRPYHTRQEARLEVFEYLKGFYNRSRRHSALGYLSPVEFEQRTAQSTSSVHLSRGKIKSKNFCWSRLE